MNATLTTRAFDIAMTAGLFSIVVLMVGYVWPIATYRFLLH